MPKFEFVDDDNAPPDLGDMTKETREKLAMLQGLTIGKTLVIEHPDGQRGYKAAMTRLARKHHIMVKIWSNGGKVCVRLIPRLSD